MACHKSYFQASIEVDVLTANGHYESHDISPASIIRTGLEIGHFYLVPSVKIGEISQEYNADNELHNTPEVLETLSYKLHTFVAVAEQDYTTTHLCASLGYVHTYTEVPNQDKKINSSTCYFYVVHIISDLLHLLSAYPCELPKENSRYYTYRHFAEDTDTAIECLEEWLTTNKIDHFLQTLFYQHRVQYIWDASNQIPYHYTILQPCEFVKRTNINKTVDLRELQEPQPYDSVLKNTPFRCPLRQPHQ